MKRSIIIALGLCIVLAACNKAGNKNGGKWTFKGQTYNATFCSFILGALTASTETNTPSGTLAFYFPNNSMIAGNYLATNSNYTINYLTHQVVVSPGYVYIQLTDTAINNVWVVSPSNNNAVTVTVTAPGGLATVNVPPVMVVNEQNLALPLVGSPAGTDSSLISGTLYQTPLN